MLKINNEISERIQYKNRKGLPNPAFKKLAA